MPDVFEVLTSDRPYHRGMPAAEARHRTEDGAGAHFDPDVVRVLLASPRIGALAEEIDATREPATTPA